MSGVPILIPSGFRNRLHDLAVKHGVKQRELVQFLLEEGIARGIDSTRVREAAYRMREEKIRSSLHLSVRPK